MEKRISLRLDEEYINILNELCQSKNISTSEAIRVLLKDDTNTKEMSIRNSNENDFYEHERFKKLEELQSKLLDIFDDLYNQNETIENTLKSIENKINKNDDYIQKNPKKEVTDINFQELGKIVRNFKSLELIDSIKTQIPAFYNEYIKIK